MRRLNRAAVRNGNVSFLRQQIAELRAQFPAGAVGYGGFPVAHEFQLGNAEAILARYEAATTFRQRWQAWKDVNIRIKNSRAALDLYLWRTRKVGR